MNNDIYLNFICETIKQQLLIEDIKITKFLKDKEIKQKNITKKNLKTTLYTCEINLENAKKLLIEDLPINFFLSHTILIGDKAQLLQFQAKKNNEEQETNMYICEKNLFKEIKNTLKIDQSTIKEIKAKELFNKKYSFNFKQPKIMQQLKEYISSIKKLPFNKIHIVKGEKVENFIPTIKSSHLEIAKNLKIPLIPLLHNNYIKESTINIYDNETIKKLISPIYQKEIKIPLDTYKDNNLKLYKDIITKYLIQYDKETIIQKILNSQKTNFDKEQIIKEINGINHIELSSNYGTYPLPLWKSINKQEFVQIEDTNSFREITGVNFKLDSNFFKNIYIQSLEGEKAIYKEKFLSQELNKAIETMQKDQRITFSTAKELIIKILYNQDIQSPQILKNEKINDQKIENLSKNINKINSNIIQYSIEHNKHPTYKKPTQLFENYYLSLCASLEQITQNYKKYPSQKNLIKQTLKIANKINSTIKTFPPNPEELYFISINLLTLNQILHKFNPQNSQEIEEKFYSYFKDFKDKTKYKQTIPQTEKIVNDIILANKISKKHKTYIFEKKPLPEKLIKKSHKLQQEPTYTKHIKPNKKKIKEIFKYQQEEISQKISQLSPKEAQAGVRINLKNKIIKIYPQLFSIQKIYKEYTKKIENEYFILLTQN